MARRRVRLLVTIIAIAVSVYVSRHWLYVSALAFCGSIMLASWFGISIVWPERRRWWR
jgi:hypothetical protein